MQSDPLRQNPPASSDESTVTSYSEGGHLMGTTLKEELDALRASFAKNIAPVALGIIRNSYKDLIDSGQAERVLGVGDLAPDFELSDSRGRHVRSRDLLAKGPMVLSFYRGQWCAFCNAELEALQRVHAEVPYLCRTCPFSSVAVRRVRRSPAGHSYSSSSAM